jgi:hypothetical protein
MLFDVVVRFSGQNAEVFLDLLKAKAWLVAEKD